MAKTVLITGCSTGFGKAAVAKFLTSEWNVVATARKKSTLANRLETENYLPLELDVTNKESIRYALDRSIKRFGDLDCVVNNAGRAIISAFEATPASAIREMFETNFFGAIEVMRAMIPHFRERGGGRFVNVASGSAITPDPLMAAYSASKSALEAMTEGLMFELRPQNIHLKLIEPGFVPTTNFIANTQESSFSIGVLPCYADVWERTMALFSQPPTYGQATEEMVAQAIYDAASESDEGLRHIVGDDALFYARMRRETSESVYQDWARSRI